MAHLPFYANSSPTNNNNNNNNHSLLANTMVGSANNTNYSPSSSSLSTTATNGIGTTTPGDYTTSRTDINLPTSNDLQKIITSYFERKGYTPENIASLRDASGNTISMDQLARYIKANHNNNSNSSTHPLTTFSNPVLQHLLNNNDDEDDLYGDPDAYATSYHQLREWIGNALDLYKPDLSTLLYPIFVHIYLDLVSKDLQEQAHYFLNHYRSDHMNGDRNHENEVNQLDKITTPQQVSENTLSQKYRNNKYRIIMFIIPYELFINYIQEFKRLNLARIVDQHLSIEVTHEKSAGGTNDMYNGIGLMVDDACISTDRLKKENDSMEIDESGSYGDTLKQVKQETSTDSPVFADITTPPTQSSDIQVELDVLKDLRKRISLGTVSLPSVCAYTFHNTHDNLNCISISDDSSLVAGGFSESFIKVWSLKGESLRKPTDDNEKGNSDYVRLIGHAGPVYGASFNQDNEYLISCSQDQSARLWNMRTFENVVVYKSHNYPVWDVDFGPFGFYFATASHDKTARLWSCDHTYPLRIFAGHLSDVDVVKFHPNSKYLVTGSSDRTARLWDVQRGSCVRVFTGHTGGVKTVAISPNGRLMASAGEDTTVNLWDLGSGRRLKTMTGHRDHVYSLDFSADSHVLVSGGADNTVRVWDVNSGTQSTSSTATSSSSGAIMRPNETNMKRMRLEESNRKDKGDKKMDDNRHSNSPLANHHPLAVFPTKQTPIYTVKFTKRNLCLVAGAFIP
ncbi:WD40-repeat-containing domain protein [Chlamydoabsidia padenii]|nr:WD40-repeat-containing domain protein [Chlamydoabsidia padenii]